MAQLRIKVLGSFDDIQAFIEFLNSSFQGHVLATPLRKNDQGDPGYHAFIDVSMKDLRKIGEASK